MKIEQPTEIYRKYQNWQYKNTFLLVVCIFVLVNLWESDVLLGLISIMGDLGYVSAFFAGILFVSIFTVAPAVLVLYDLAEKLDPVLLALVAGAGAVLGDYIIYNFFKNKVFDELKPLYTKISWPEFFVKTFKTPYFSWIIPLFGAFLIASPFPDELGVMILGLSKVRRWQFITVTFLLNAVGILLIITIATL